MSSSSRSRLSIVDEEEPSKGNDEDSSEDKAPSSSSLSSCSSYCEYNTSFPTVEKAVTATLRALSRIWSPVKVRALIEHHEAQGLFLEKAIFLSQDGLSREVKALSHVTKRLAADCAEKEVKLLAIFARQDADAAAQREVAQAEKERWKTKQLERKRREKAERLLSRRRREGTIRTVEVYDEAAWDEEAQVITTTLGMGADVGGGTALMVRKREKGEQSHAHSLDCAVGDGGPSPATALVESVDVKLMTPRASSSAGVTMTDADTKCVAYPHRSVPKQSTSSSGNPALLGGRGRRQ